MDNMIFGNMMEAQGHFSKIPGAAVIFWWL